MLCTACGSQAAVVGRFCGSCDHRARGGSVERRRPVGGVQWQALWGINYAPLPDAVRRHRVQGGITAAVVVVGVFLLNF